MKWLPMSAVFLSAFFGFVLESAQDKPSPVVVTPEEERQKKRRRERDAYIAEIERQIDEMTMARLLRNDQPRYLYGLYDAGIMTADLHAKCSQCDGWGMMNRDRGDASLCRPCDATGLSATTTLRRPPSRTRKMPKGLRILER
jgi:hypothetical protein